MARNIYADGPSEQYRNPVHGAWDYPQQAPDFAAPEGYYRDTYAENRPYDSLGDALMYGLHGALMSGYDVINGGLNRLSPFARPVSEASGRVVDAYTAPYRYPVDAMEEYYRNRGR